MITQHANFVVNVIRDYTVGIADIDEIAKHSSCDRKKVALLKVSLKMTRHSGACVTTTTSNAKCDHTIRTKGACLTGLSTPGGEIFSTYVIKDK